MRNNAEVLVIGGGPAGMIAAGKAAEAGHRVCLLEKNKEPGKKLLITGKGRCNVTNNCSHEEFIEQMPGNGRFLHSAYRQFSSRQLQEFFRSLGVPLKIERGKRVFPQSDKASDIRDALVLYIKKNQVDILPDSQVIDMKEENGQWVVMTHNKKRLKSQRVIGAFGGASYTKTGSTGDGYPLAKAQGHTLIPMKPSLVPLVCSEPWPIRLLDLTLKNVRVEAFTLAGKSLGEEFGELAFTEDGVSGPVILTLSRALSLYGVSPEKPVKLLVDLKPSLSEEQLKNRLDRDFTYFQRKHFKNAFAKLLPKAFIPVFIQQSGIDPETPVHQITKEQKSTLLKRLKGVSLTVVKTRPLEEAVVTMGGVSTKEVDPGTMESKISPGLYFCGEMLDIDGYTGGFNLQAAFTTGYTAGKHAALSLF